ncbi:hypothetical protein F5Y11DRAFT_322857 [Daldinia sp. FL1419]|nr:hypothetical protein F5Y11DRAFT_322857 [Daldinia sp. FL1419]
MASVTSLDKDLRKLRLEKYTPAAANEARSWIESVLGDRLSSNDLLDSLKDGVALCKLVNLAVGPPGVKFKQSSMPFIQMENISHFLRACQSPPLNLQDHDVFLTVDLYERKDPAQVLQCLGAFSRAAHSVNPSVFPTPIGLKAKVSTMTMSPQSTGPTTPRNRGMSNVSNNSSTYGSRSGITPSKTEDSNSGRWSPTKSPTPTSERVGSPSVSSWSKRDLEGVTSPAWNIAQYGYMGGASQGNLGISFGGRRQITSASPHVPNLADKERRRKEQEAEAERQRLQVEDEERVRKAELEAEEEREKLDEEHRWEEEARRLRAEEKRKAEEEKRRWEEEERQWKLTEEKRRREEEEAEAKLAEERRRAKAQNDGRLQGQFLSQYQAEHGIMPQKSGGGGYSDRIKQLEQELELARKREMEYEEERQKRSQNRARSRSRPKKTESRPPSRQDSWRPKDEREFLSTQWNRRQQEQREREQQEQLQEIAPPPPPRPLPVPVLAAPVQTNRTGENPPPVPVKPQRTGEGRPLPIPDRIRNQVTGGPAPGPSPSARPLPVPSSSSNGSRTDRFLATNPAPAPVPPQQTYSRELEATAERDAEDKRRAESQAKTKAAGWAGKSLLEREMEMERQRQREWEEAQQETAKAARAGDGVDGIGGGIGGRWDVSQWSGYTGGDSQNKGSAGIGAGRRQIVGPRPLPSRPGS